MNERVRDILADASRWAKEAGAEWRESIEDSPPAHVYTLIVGGLVATAIRLAF